MCSLVERLRAVTKTHALLVKNSVAIAIGNGAGAMCGFLYWWVAARWLHPEVIGTASGLLSLMNFTGLLGDAGLGTLLAGETIRWPGRERGLVSAAAIVAFSLSLGTGIVILAFSKHVLSNPALVNLYWIAGCGITGLSLVIDQAWLGLLESHFRMIRHVILAIFKLVFLGMALIWFSGILVLLGSWVTALIVSLVTVELLMRRHNKSLFHPPDFPLLSSLKSQVVHHYRLDIGIMAPSLLLPYLVWVLLSSSVNAVFTMIWMIVLVASIVPSTLATVLFPTIQAEPHHYRNRMSLSLGISLIYALAFGVFIFMFSTDILTLFSPAYAVIGDGNLRVLGFGMIGSVIKAHICAAARINNRMRDASVSVVLAAVFELISVAIGAHFGGLEGLAWAWTMATLVEAAVLLAVNPVYRRTGDVVATAAL
jgi:O-antigen/teichoic acid export membrane protein